MGLAGFLVEQVSGKSYEQNLKEKIFVPLGMTNSFVSNTEILTINAAQGYLAAKRVPFTSFSLYLQRAGAIKSTANDMMLYLDSFMNSTTTSAVGWAFLLVRQSTLKNGSTEKGIIWTIVCETNNTIYWHNGGTEGFSTFTGYTDSSKAGVFIMANGSAPASNINEVGFAALRELAEE